MPRVNSQEYAANWQEGMLGSSTKAQRGVNRVKEAPGKKAAARKAQYIKGVNDAAERWATNVAAVPLSTWQESYIQKGIPAMQNAIPLALPKVERRGAELLNAISELEATLPPKGATIEQNMQRSLHMAKGLRKKFKGLSA